jgi:DNA-3-methyladenine glycosylase
MKKLAKSFYAQENVLQIARELLGKILVTNFNGRITSGRIVETEAYNGITDKASHAFGGRRTRRTEVMYAEAGVAYVYLCYGIHHLFNIVTNQKDIPHAILIRALEPVAGIVEMLKRSGKQNPDFSLTSGPGNLSRALGISTAHTGLSLKGDTIYIADDGIRYTKNEIAVSARIGVAYAAEDALLPYRFFIKGNPFISGKPK